MDIEIRNMINLAMETLNKDSELTRSEKMKLSEMKLDDLLYMNLHMLARKLFNSIDYKVYEKINYLVPEKEKIGYKGQRGPTGRYEEVPVYEIINKSISKDKYYELKRNGKYVQKSVTKTAVTYEDEFEKILSSKAKNKEEALNKLYNNFYNLADEYITELQKYKSFLNEDYLNKVKVNLKPTMEHYINKILNKEIV